MGDPAPGTRYEAFTLRCAVRKRAIKFTLSPGQVAANCNARIRLIDFRKAQAAGATYRMPRVSAGLTDRFLVDHLRLARDAPSLQRTTEDASIPAFVMLIL